MEIRLADNLKIETDIPILYVESFWFSWKPCTHAMLELKGYVDRNIQWNPENSYRSCIKICMTDEGKSKIIYHGYIVEVEISNVGKTSKIHLEAMSASGLLDREIKSRSFQDTTKTYGEVVRESVQADGGQVIRNQESDKKIVSPIIRYEETTWQFANRMGSCLGVYVIPDIETGNSNLWFGMRKGKEVPAFSEEECVLQMHSIGKWRGLHFRVEGRSFYKIGDWTIYFTQKVTIMEVEGRYEHGELSFLYVLTDRTVYQPELWVANHQTGQGFWGTIKAVKREYVKLALDIDQGESTGDYFYPWYPETGNALYAMPEVGARVLLCFFGIGEQEGAVIHSLNKEGRSSEHYEHRALDIKDGNSIKLSSENLGFSRHENHRVFLGDQTITASTSGRIKILAEAKVRLKARKIIINTLNELNLYQG